MVILQSNSYLKNHEASNTLDETVLAIVEQTKQRPSTRNVEDLCLQLNMHIENINNMFLQYLLAAYTRNTSAEH